MFLKEAHIYQFIKAEVEIGIGAHIPVQLKKEKEQILLNLQLILYWMELVLYFFLDSSQS